MTNNHELRTPEIRTGRKKLISSMSLIWLVPILALAGALGLVLQSYLNRDVPIEIRFENAEGIEVGKTEIKYREMKVGTVTGMKFSEDLTQVIVKASIKHDMDRYLDTDAKFWLVTARLGPSGISGLTTLLSGAYISVDWTAKHGVEKRKFTAEAEAPIVPPGAKGIAIILNSPNSGSISVGAPILHKGVSMGKIEAVKYDVQSDRVLITGFINAPYDKLINTETRFWNESGIGLQLGESGLELKVGSLSSLLQGGVAFETITSGGKPPSKDEVFTLYSNQTKAKDSLLSDTLSATVQLSSSFEGSVKGLKEDADVFFHGVKIGQVKSLSAITETNEKGEPDIRMMVTYTVQPSRLGLHDVKTPEETLDLLAPMVKDTGLRARLAPNSIFLGGLHIELYEDPKAEPAVLQLDVKPYPIMPSTPTPPDTLAVATENIMDRVASLPLEEVMNRAIEVMGSINTLVSSQDTQKIPADVRAFLDNINTVASSESLRNLPDKLDSAVASVNTILGKFEEAKGVQSLVNAFTEVRTAAANVSTATNGFPKLVTDIDAFVKKADDLPLDSVVSSADGVLKSANVFLQNKDLEKVPGALSGALVAAEQTLDELRDGGAVKNLNETLASARTAAENISTAVKGLPELSKRLDQLADSAEATIAAYGPNSPVNRELQAAIDDLRTTARSLNSLVQAIRRKPNSLLVGR